MDNTNTPEATAIGFELPSYEVAPEDAGRAQRLQSFDPVFDTSGPATGGEGMTVPDQFKATMLPVEIRQKIEDQLAGVPQALRVQKEHELVYAALYDNAFEMRVAMGPGDSANAYQREYFSQLNEGRQMQQELQQLQADLAEVVDKRREFDEASGEYVFIDIHKLQGEQRTIAMNRVEELGYKMMLLRDVEGPRRLQKELVESISAEKRLEEAAADDAEARQTAKDNIRRKRVAEKTALYEKAEGGLA